MSDEKRVKLQEFLKVCLANGRFPFSMVSKEETTAISIVTLENCIQYRYKVASWDTRSRTERGYALLSYHDLFSKDSGIMEFVERRPLTKASSIQLKILHEYHLTDYSYVMMSLLTADEKVLYFLDNARLPQ